MIVPPATTHIQSPTVRQSGDQSEAENSLRSSLLYADLVTHTQLVIERLDTYVAFCAELFLPYIAGMGTLPDAW